MKLSMCSGVLLISLVLAGCGSPNRPWVKGNAVRSATDQALEECKYQAEAATIGIGAGGHPKTLNKAIGQGIGDGVIRALDEEELVEHCMKAKGFSR
jgi:hypothetical protein